MTTEPHTTTPEAATPRSGAIFLLVIRVFWMFLGYMAFFLAALGIMYNRYTLFCVADIVFLIVAPLMIGARYLDVTRFHGATAYGEPATLAHWRKYAVSVLVLAAVIFGASHGFVSVMVD